ncbi:MAG: hypothetical protein L0Y66_27175 [Myxococcaceae bacterium]|nr:hypothetical protein [Myxococcaceae bacterium]MCI0669880.1 hypothetical protein [Myxococcaceae bacterium]
MNDFQQKDGDGAQGPGGFGERVDRVGTDAQQLWSDARGAVDELNASLDLKGRVERNPYAMVAAAFGVGYLLGGGLFTPLTARVVRLGVRLAALPFVKDELIRMAEVALENVKASRASPTGEPPEAGPSRPA